LTTSYQASNFRAPFIVTNEKFSTPSAIIIKNSIRAEKGRTSTQLDGLITGTKEEEIVDEGLGGVRLANTTVLKFNGSNAGNEKGEGIFSDYVTFSRYTKLTSFSENDDFVQNRLSSGSTTVIARGNGKDFLELIEDDTDKNALFAPVYAVNQALSSMSSEDVEAAKKAKKLVLNFAGGDDLRTFYVWKAAESMVNELDVKNIQIEYHSLSFNTFPDDECSVTVVALLGEEEENDTSQKTPLEISLTRGEMFFNDGKWFTVLDTDITEDEDVFEE